jgi:tetratricopeptide (TPR) repeat protein
MAKQKISVKTRMEEARLLEKEGKNAEALKIYRTLTRRKQLNAAAYSRMMVILRKQKKYEHELEIIRQAIDAAEAAITSSQQAFDVKDPESAVLGRKLAKSLGLLNDEGFPVHEEPQLAAWRKREAVVEKRLASKY